MSDSNGRTPILLACIATLLALVLTSRVEATQHLVRAGESWDLFQARIKPGDEIILMPGRHRPAWLRGVRGTADRPIVIRGLDPDNPPIIDAARFGIRLDRPAHLRIFDLQIQGATINGILLDGRADLEPQDPLALASPKPAPKPEPKPKPSGPDAFSGNVILRNVTVADTGPGPSRHAICARHLVRVVVDACVVDGWGGSGLELIGVEDARVLDMRFIGKDGYQQLSGVRARAGADRVFIDRCRFENTGDQGISIGAGSKLEEFSPPPPEKTRPGSRFEASRVRVRRCVFVGGRCAVAFVNCERSVVRNCTVVRPTRAVVSIRHEQTDPRFGGTTRCDFGSNLITWDDGDLDTLTHLAGGATADTLNLEQNLWWTPNWHDVRERLGPFPGIAQFPQMTDVDPQMDDELRPHAQAAAIFGAYAP